MKIFSIWVFKKSSSNFASVASNVKKKEVERDKKNPSKAWIIMGENRLLTLEIILLHHIHTITIF